LIALVIIQLCKRLFGDGVHNFLRRTVNIVFSLIVLFWLFGIVVTGLVDKEKEEEAAIREAEKKAEVEKIENVMTDADIVIFCPVPKVIGIDYGDSNQYYGKGSLWGTKEYYVIPNQDDIEKSLLVIINTDNGDSWGSFDMIKERSEQTLGVDGFALNRTDLLMRDTILSYSDYLSWSDDGSSHHKPDGSTVVETQCVHINDPKNISKIIKEKETEYKAEKEKRILEKEKLEKNKVKEAQKENQDVIDSRQF